jgi:hypothetical protein
MGQGTLHGGQAEKTKKGKTELYIFKNDTEPTAEYFRTSSDINTDAVQYKTNSTP